MGSFRSEPQLKKCTFQMSSRDHSYASCEMCGWRKYMEDATLSISPFTYKNYSLFCVFDGHGGPQVAHYAKKHFPQELEKNLNFKKGNFEEALRQTFLLIDKLLNEPTGEQQLLAIRKQQIQLNNSSDVSSLKRIGCTALAALVTKQYVYVANAGDCRLVVSTYSKECKPITKDHKPGDPIELKRIKDAGGSVENGRVNGCLNLSRAMGDLEFKNNKDLKLEEQAITSFPDIFKVPRQDLHFMIMGCDGIWECKTSQQMTSWIASKLEKRVPLGKILEGLLDDMVAKTSKDDLGTDNMSSILVKFDPKK